MKIMIGKSKYTLEQVKDFGRNAHIGEIKYKEKKITLASHGGITSTPLSTMERRTAFWHEVTHAILWDMHSSMYCRERFVDRFSRRLAKVIEQVGNYENVMVPQRTKRLRELRKKIPRSKSVKAVPPGQNRANSVRRAASQGSGGVRKRGAITATV